MYTWTRNSNFDDDLGLTFAGGCERPDGDLVLGVVLEVKYFLVRPFWVADHRLENVAVYAASRCTAHHFKCHNYYSDTWRTHANHGPI